MNKISIGDVTSPCEPCWSARGCIGEKAIRYRGKVCRTVRGRMEKRGKIRKWEKKKRKERVRKERKEKSVRIMEEVRCK